MPSARILMSYRTTILILLTLAAGCTPTQPPRPDFTASAPSPSAAAPTPAGKSSPLPQRDALTRAEDKAASAQTIAQSARSQDDWSLVVKRWEQAIALLQSIPPSHPKKALAEKKIAEYQRHLATAQQQTAPKNSWLPGIFRKTESATPTRSNSATCNFLVMGGGGAPSYNEIALEKNIRYFQRTLRTLGHNPEEATVFFANGDDGEATVRYIDDDGEQQFKAPDIPYLKGASTLPNFQTWLRQTAAQKVQRPIFFYFTGHGLKNPQNANNNTLVLWNEKYLSVQQLSRYLDTLPQNTPIVTMMAQCYAGSFANFIYQGGDPKRPVALQTRCGFFATVSTRTSVGCTPEVNEADYKDYSSSFFAGLSGRSRTGEPVASADYNRDGRVSYAEAHAFAKVDEQTTDWPISTSEAWLQRRTSTKERDFFLSQPITQIVQTARPEQRYVVESIVQMLDINPKKSWQENWQAKGQAVVSNEEEEAYWIRLNMELTSISMEKKVRMAGKQQDIKMLNRLIKCESGSWGKL